MLKEEIKQHLKDFYKAHDIVIDKMSTEEGNGAIVKYTIIQDTDDIFNETHTEVIAKNENGFKRSLPNVKIRMNF